MQQMLALALGAGGGAALAHLVDSRKVKSARLDPMTGLHTRAGFETRAKRALAKGPTTVAMMDLDGLKAINDSQGHDRGDQLIRTAADKIRRWLPDKAVIARLGGDEFAAVWAAGSMDPDDMNALASELSISIGVVVAPKGTDYATAMKAADAAMYLVKKTGGGWGSMSRIDEAPQGLPGRWSRNGKRDAGRLGWR